MLSSCKIELQAADKRSFPFDAGSIFHGYLMSLVDKERAGQLHWPGLKPFSQFIIWEGDRLFWVIHTFTERARKTLINPLLAPEVQSVNLEHKETTLPILSKTVHDTSYESLINKHYFGDANRFVPLKFLTPTSFKVQGKHLNFPNMFNFYQSLMMKHDAFNSSNETLDRAVLEELTARTEIQHYKLRSYQFHVDKGRIPSFLGEVVLRLNMNKNLANFAHFLFRFGEYTGVGVKASLGMGAISLKERS